MEHMISCTGWVWVMVTDMLPDRVLGKVAREIQDIGDMIFWERVMDISDRLVWGVERGMAINILFAESGMPGAGSG